MSFAVIGFVVLFAGGVALIVAANRKERKRWTARAETLRAFALRRGAQIVEPPPEPSQLGPVHPFRNADVTRAELSAAVRGRTSGSEYTLYDLSTETVTTDGDGSRSHVRHYLTYVNVKSGEFRWPRFEFLAISAAPPDTVEGRLLQMAGSVAAAQMASRGLRHVEFASKPGFQLYAGDSEDGKQLTPAMLLRVFESRIGWWAAADGTTLSLSKNVKHSTNVGAMVPEQELDAFLDTALEIERALRRQLSEEG
jgi:hypothetical protein